MSTKNVCKTCGGSVERIGNYYICEYCGNKWEIDSSNDINAVERANAWAALRDGNFEKATELFDNIIVKENQNHEAYWGRALALAGIVYVTDLSENKKVPTCNNITEQSFAGGNDVQKAILLAPEDIAQTYRKQADYIEKVRIEWLEKASKEPAYDVFISFKDSDRENGVERTQDSIDAQDLYNALVAEGYKVFFSRISLRDKISEQYEPYIYNAIKTAKVMIVFGEKPEYFSSVWLKNEWTRFKHRIEKGEKHKNSLVVVYKNMNPGDLPAVLRSRQCMNAADMTFLSDLNRHIKRVVDEAKKNEHLNKIEIVGGQIAKKATTLAVNGIRIREIGAGAIAETSISEKQSIDLIRTYLKEKQWEISKKLAEDILFENPGCAEAIWCELLAKYEATDDTELLNRLDLFQDGDYASIDKMLNCASTEFAQQKLLDLYGAEKNTTDAAYCRLLNVILPYAFSERANQIDAAFCAVIQNAKFKSFQVLLNTLDPSDVEAYVFYNYQFAISIEQFNNKDKILARSVCLQNIISVDAGNVDALRELVFSDLVLNRAEFIVTKGFEDVLRYAPQPNQEVIICLQWLGEHLAYSENCNFAKQLLRYYSGNLSDLRDHIKGIGYRMLDRCLFDEAEYFFNLMLTINANDPDAYWGICLLKISARSEDNLAESDGNVLLQTLPEFNKYLTLVDEARRNACMQLLGIQNIALARQRVAYVKSFVPDMDVYLDTDNHKIKSIKHDPVENHLSGYQVKRILYADLCGNAGRLFFLTMDNLLYKYEYGYKQVDWDRVNYQVEKLPTRENTEIIDCSVRTSDEIVILYSDGTLEFSDGVSAFSKDFYSVKHGKIRHQCYFREEKDIVEECSASGNHNAYGLNIDGTILRRYQYYKEVKEDTFPGIHNAIQLYGVSTRYCRFDLALLADGTLNILEGGYIDSEWLDAIRSLKGIAAILDRGYHELAFVTSKGTVIRIKEGITKLEVTHSYEIRFHNLDEIIEQDRLEALQKCKGTIWDERHIKVENRKSVEEAIEKCQKYCSYKRIFSGEVPSTRQNWVAAQEGFESISEWCDANVLALKCAEKVHAFDEAARMARERREAQVAALRKEEATLQAELTNLKGLFTGKRRKQIQESLSGIACQLAKLNDTSDT